MRIPFSLRLLLLALLLVALEPNVVLAKDGKVAKPRNTFSLAAGIDGHWLDRVGLDAASDVEATVEAKACVTHHVDLVTSSAYGLDHRYYRYTAGARVIATDKRDTGFSIGVGIQYRGSQDRRLGPDEWAPDATLAWCPWPRLRKVSLGAQGWYGLDSQLGGVLLSARYAIY